MMIGPVGSNPYNAYMVGAMSYSPAGATGVDAARESKPIVNPGESTEVAPGRKSSPAECKTCKERKYQDGSDEMVSYKGATHISPESSVAKVMAHEQEHVANAYSKAAKAGGKVLQASVQIKMAICPECGRAYSAGGCTTTKISYPNDPYSKNRKSADSMVTSGGNFDKAV